jgi:hypothetical protein
MKIPLTLRARTALRAGDLSSELQLSQQNYSQAFQTLSNIMKSNAATQSNIVSNIKP